MSRRRARVPLLQRRQGRLAINLVFAGPVRLDAAGIGGVAGTRATFAEAFFLSGQTLGSIGKGVLHPTSPAVNLIVTGESVGAIRFGHGFVDMVRQHGAPRLIDWSQFNRIRPCPEGLRPPE